MLDTACPACASGKDQVEGLWKDRAGLQITEHQKLLVSKLQNLFYFRGSYISCFLNIMNTGGNCAHHNSQFLKTGRNNRLSILKTDYPVILYDAFKACQALKHDNHVMILFFKVIVIWLNAVKLHCSI